MKLKWIKFAVAIFLVFVFLERGSGQTFLQFQTNQGYTIPHNSDVRELKGFPLMMKLDYSVRLKTKEYHEKMNFPLAGVSLTYIDHDNVDTGSSLAIGGFLQPTIATWGKHQLSNRVTFGMAYVENPFDPVNNQIQKAIGSNVNYYGEAQLLYTYQLSEIIGVNAQTGITHISNAARKLPNAGLNIVFAGAGINYRISEHSSQVFGKFNQRNLPYQLGELKHMLIFSAGARSVRALDYAVFPAFGLSHLSALRYSALGSWTMGLDVDYNRGYISERRLINQNSNGENPFYSFRPGVSAGHQLHMNRLSLLTQFAAYVIRPHANHNYFYQRYGLHYQIGENWLVAAALRAHGGRADYMEWSLGYRF